MTKLAFFKAKAELQEGSFRDTTSKFGRFPIAMLSARVCYITSLVIKSHRCVGSLVRGECIQSAGGGIRRSWRLAEWKCGTRISYEASWQANTLQRRSWQLATGKSVKGDIFTFRIRK
jgi:hypothetical protein